MDFSSLFSTPPNHALDQSEPDRNQGGDDRGNGALGYGEIGFKEVEKGIPLARKKSKGENRKDEKQDLFRKPLWIETEQRQPKSKRQRRQRGPQRPVQNAAGHGAAEHSHTEEEEKADRLNKYHQTQEVLLPPAGRGRTGPLLGQMKRPGTTELQRKEHAQKGGEQTDVDSGLCRPNKKKCRNRGSGRGRGTALQGSWVRNRQDDSRSVKRKPFMTPEFINQHAVPYKGRHICKYFLAGRCIKEDQCKFEHDLVVPDKKQELCKFYVQGFCSKGESCMFMHSDYPCKFYHTGTKCYQGDQCKFSHAPLTDQTRELLEKVLNKNEPKEEDQRNADPTPLTPPTAAPADSHRSPLTQIRLFNSSCPSEGPGLITGHLPHQAFCPASLAYHPPPSLHGAPLQCCCNAGSQAENCVSGTDDEAGIQDLERGEDEDEEENGEPVVIPLDRLQSTLLKDPRRLMQRPGIVLAPPAFAQEMVWDSLDQSPFCVQQSCGPCPYEGATSSSLEAPPITKPPSGEGTLLGWGTNTAAPAVHKLPVKVLTQLPRAKASQARWTGESQGGKDLDGLAERPLKDVFKTFDPTSSPFCQ